MVYFMVQVSYMMKIQDKFYSMVGFMRAITKDILANKSFPKTKILKMKTHLQSN
jgi:hypothetical protein